MRWFNLCLDLLYNENQNLKGKIIDSYQVTLYGQIKDSC